MTPLQQRAALRRLVKRLPPATTFDHATAAGILFSVNGYENARAYLLKVISTPSLNAPAQEVPRHALTLAAPAAPGSQLPSEVSSVSRESQPDAAGDTAQTDTAQILGVCDGCGDYALLTADTLPVLCEGRWGQIPGDWCCACLREAWEGDDRSAESREAERMTAQGDALYLRITGEIE